MVRFGRAASPAATLWVLLLAFALLCGGVRRDLPAILEVDEPTFVGGAVAITSGRPDPDWYGHPGATFFYGLAGLLWVDSAIQPHGRPLAERFAARDPALFLYGRLINVWFAFLAAAALVPLSRRVLGARAGERQGLLAALLLAAMPLVIEQVTISRTDGLLLFFTTLGVMVWVRLIVELTTRKIVLAGIVTGAATATKYQLGLFAPLLGLTIWAAPQRRRARTVLLFGGAAALAFALLSPYVLIDWRQALQQLRFESRSSHPGADGLTPVGNLLWYLGAALPQTLSVLLPFVLVGAVGVWRDRPVPARRLVVFPAIYLFFTALLALHWQRWLLPLLPPLALLAAHGLWLTGRWLSHRLPGIRQAGPALAMLIVTVAVARGAWTTWQLSQPSTRVAARRWLLDQPSRPLRVAYEEYSVDNLVAPDIGYLRAFSLAMTRFPTPAALADHGMDYAVVSSEIYDRFWLVGNRYAKERVFYEALFATGAPVAEFVPRWNRPGPVIRIYALTPR